MCGIFGLVIPENSTFNHNIIRDIIAKLYLLSESRGKEAAGMAIFNENQIEIYKSPISASKFIKTQKFQDIVSNSLNCNSTGNLSCYWALIGHSRLVTNGIKESNYNNQPVALDKVVCVHNGIVVNDVDLETQYPEIKRTSNLDSEIIARLIQLNTANGETLPGAIQETFKKIRGEASIGMLFKEYDNLALATNTGSIYCLGNNEIFLFASERFILLELCAYKKFRSLLNIEEIFQLKPYHGCIINIQSSDYTTFNFSSTSKLNQLDDSSIRNIGNRVSIIDHSEYNPNEKNNQYRYDIGNRDRIRKIIEDQPRPDDSLKRCTKCILPETFPFIEFDEDGVCNYCRSYNPVELKGKDALKELVKDYKSDIGENDCIIGFSGGRDSSYALHYARKVLGMNPIAFTFDWGMVTDLARRNCARICGELEVEHIIVSADLEKKWMNVRKNLRAWLKKPWSHWEEVI